MIDDKPSDRLLQGVTSSGMEHELIKRKPLILRRAGLIAPGRVTRFHYVLKTECFSGHLLKDHPFEPESLDWQMNRALFTLPPLHLIP